MTRSPRRIAFFWLRAYCAHNFVVGLNSAGEVVVVGKSVIAPDRQQDARCRPRLISCCTRVRLSLDRNLVGRLGQAMGKRGAGAFTSGKSDIQSASMTT